MKISSLQNPKIKQVLALSKPAERREKNLFIIEGFREITRAVSNKVEITGVFYYPAILTGEAATWLSEFRNEAERYEVTGKVYAKIAYRENTDGLLVIASMKELSLDDLDPGRNPLILVLESVEKPGNLGAIFRSADAAGVDAVLICDPTTDIYNPNVIRASIGCMFSNRVVKCESESALKWLNNRGILIYAAALQDAIPFTEVDFTGPSAIVLGSEAKGLSLIWRQHAYKIIRIMMSGIADSLNVSVSAAILTFEAVRQRHALRGSIKT